MVLFGEIVEPSSRALWEDDFIDYPEEDDKQLQLSENIKVPDVVDKFFIGESTNIINILQKCVLQELKPICHVVKADTVLYNVNVNSYMLLYKPQADIPVGKITEMFKPWLNAARNIYILTSSTITSLQNCNLNDRTSTCIIKFLSSKKIESNLYSRLEVPNLVTGLGASVLSYSMHKGLTCTLYVGFLEDAALDSTNTKPLLDLLGNLGISSMKNYILENKLPLNNLYM